MRELRWWWGMETVEDGRGSGRTILRNRLHASRLTSGRVPLPGSEDDYGHPRSVSGKDHVDQQLKHEGNIRVEGGGLSDEMVGDNPLSKTSEGAMNTKALVFCRCINKKT